MVTWVYGGLNVIIDEERQFLLSPDWVNFFRTCERMRSGPRRPWAVLVPSLSMATVHTFRASAWAHATVTLENSGEFLTGEF